MRIQRTVYGFYVVGRRYLLTVKRLPHNRPIQAGIWQWSRGRFLVRLSRRVTPRCVRCGA